MSYTDFFDSFDDFDFNIDFDTELQDETSQIEDQLEAYLKNYYNFNPDTLMPLLFVTLAAKGCLRVTENYRPVQGAYKSFDLNEMKNLQWVKSDDGLKKRVNNLLRKGYESVDIEFELDTLTASIYNIFLKNDEETVVQEYHHRIGRLINHREDSASYKTHQKYAALLLVRLLIDNQDYIVDNYLEIFNSILELSRLQPSRPRIKVASAIEQLAGFTGGKVYYPFAGVGLAGANICADAGNDYFADADNNQNLFAAGQLLIYGQGGSTLHFVQRDSTLWINENDLDCVISTYRGYVNGKNAISFCYDKCMQTLSETGRYVGVVTSSALFSSDSRNHTDLYELVRTSVDNDTLDTIVILPFNESVVLFNRKKTTPGVIKICNLNSPFLNINDIDFLLASGEGVVTMTAAKIKKNKYKIGKAINRGLQRIEGYEIVPARNYLLRLEKKAHATDDLDYRDKAMLHIDRVTPYDKLPRERMAGLEKKPFRSLLNPAYYLDENALIVNAEGDLEPRFFDADYGAAFFDEGLAFAFAPGINFNWFMSQLSETYVLDQLYPYGKDTMLPNKITEDMILSLDLYIPIFATEESQYLENGYTLHDTVGQMDYTILRYLSHGAFGCTYRALQKDLRNGEVTEVVLKEFFLSNGGECYRKDNVVRVNYGSEDVFEHYIEGFKREAEILMRIGKDSENHVMRVLNFFESKETCTSYYVMNHYANGSLDALHKRVGNLNESDVIEHVIKPICYALNVVHSENILHLDIKPDNIMLDENMNATLTDFGIAKVYDKSGQEVSNEAPTGTNVYAAPEQCGRGHLIKFATPTDIYSFSGTLYKILTGNNPHSITSYSDEDEDIRLFLSDCSEQTTEAIVRGLMNSPEARPQSAQEFLNLFPGCEDIKLK